MPYVRDFVLGAALGAGAFGFAWLAAAAWLRLRRPPLVCIWCLNGCAVCQTEWYKYRKRVRLARAAFAFVLVVAAWLLLLSAPRA